MTSPDPAVVAQIWLARATRTGSDLRECTSALVLEPEDSSLHSAALRSTKQQVRGLADCLQLVAVGAGWRPVPVKTPVPLIVVRRTRRRRSNASAPTPRSPLRPPARPVGQRARTAASGVTGHDRAAPRGGMAWLEAGCRPVACGNPGVPADPGPGAVNDPRSHAARPYSPTLAESAEGP